MRSLRLTIIFLLLAGITGFTVWHFTRPKPLAVHVRAVDRGVIESTVVNTRAGTIKACRRAKISPAMGGQIHAWPVKKGMTVKKGDLLLALWNRDLEAAVAVAEKEVTSSRARAEAVCLQAEALVRQAGRIRKLSRNDATTAEQLDQATSNAEARKAECLAARATADEAEARVTLARANLEKTSLLAPFDGVVAELNGELGEYITPSPPGIQTLPAVDLVDMHCAYVSAPIDEVDAASVRVGLPARITLDAIKGRPFAGQVRRVADYVLDLEKQSRTVEVEVAFDNPEDTRGLLPGFSADAEIVLDRRENVLRLPTEALVEGRKVFVLARVDGRLEERQVTTGIANWEFTEVKSGLAEGETVVVSTEKKGLAAGTAAVEEKTE